MRKKTILQEQNSFPGITTRKLSRNVNIVCTAYSEAQFHLKRKVKLFGNPVRNNIFTQNKNQAYKKYKLNPKKPIILILGGSQGSKPLNEYFIKKYKKYSNQNIQILWQTGKCHFNKLKKHMSDKNVTLIPFIENMGTAYSIADIVVTRSGAMVIEELKLLSKVMVLIPFPKASGDHQTKNALALKKNNAAIHFPQHKLESSNLEKLLFDLIKDENKKNILSQNAKAMSFPNALSDICEVIEKLGNDKYV